MAPSLTQLQSFLQTLSSPLRTAYTDEPWALREPPVESASAGGVDAVGGGVGAPNAHAWLDAAHIAALKQPTFCITLAHLADSALAFFQRHEAPDPAREPMTMEEVRVRGDFIFKQTASGVAAGPTLVDIAKMVGLNAKQYRAFVLMAASLMRSLWKRYGIVSMLSGAEPVAAGGATCAETARAQALQFHMAGFDNTETFFRGVLGDDLDRQPRLCLMGEGGTGKSESLKALFFLASCLGASEFVAVTAASGKAARNVGGDTLHHFFKTTSFDPNKNKLPEMKSDSAQALRIRRVLVVVIDEFSLMSAGDAGKLFKRLDSLGVRPAYVYVGDLCQLPPVGGPLYPTDVVRVKDPSRGNAECVRVQYDYANDPSDFVRSARANWRFSHGPTAVVQLDVNHRAKEDPLYRSILQRVREGRPTDEDAMHLNSRYGAVPPPGTPAVVGHNKMKRRVSDFTTALTLFSRKHVDVRGVAEAQTVETVDGRTVSLATHGVLLPAGVATKTQNQGLTNMATRLLWRKAVRGDMDPSLKRLSLFTVFYLGQRVAILANFDVPSGVSNKTTGLVVGFVFHDGTEFYLRREAISLPNPLNGSRVSLEYDVVVPSHPDPKKGPVAYVLVKIDGVCNFKPKEGLPPGVFPVPWSTMVKGSASGGAVRKYTVLHRCPTWKITVHGIALAAADVLTTHDYQGDTCRDGLVIYEVWNQPGNLYVQLSRVPKLSKLYLAVRIPRVALDNAGPALDSRVEMQRLLRIQQGSMDLGRPLTDQELRELNNKPPELDGIPGRLLLVFEP